MPTFKLDGKPIPFDAGDTIIKAAWKQGIEIPHYCWHAGLSAPANCRMCLVEIPPKPGARPVTLDVLEWDAKAGTYRTTQKPKLQPSCYTAAAEGMEVLSDSSEHVRKARRDVQEFLLLNHPVDCPICDQSGECKLQDYWLEHGRYQKRMRDEPVHKPKGVVFGPTIVYDGERCVMCTRCIRFMAEVAKDPVLDMRERGNLNEIFVAPGRQLDGHYTFMTEHVCPVGALTTKDFRFKARVWFLRTAAAVCQGCATGCNAHLDYDPRYNKAYRYRPRDNEKVNQFWMCDEGMLTYKEAHDGRVVQPKVRGKETSSARAMEEAKALFANINKDSVAFVFSAAHSVEDNWMLREVGATFFGSASLYMSGAAEGYEDRILIHRDKNPNTAGVRQLAPSAKPFQTLVEDVARGSITHIIALGGVAPSVASQALGGATIITVAAHEGPLTAAATVLLPATSWAEQSGTYVNAKGIKQVSEKALEPLGASRPAWRQLADLAVALGYEVSTTSLKQLRLKAIGGTIPEPLGSSRVTTSAD
jgi:NADH-quinone oxidoreductase subunit G